jgi:hypothetical protein
VLGADASYFNTDDEIAKLINSGFGKPGAAHQLSSNLDKIKNKYSWEKIIHAYFDLFKDSLRTG